MEYTLYLKGCDETTTIFLILNGEQVEFLQDICKVSKEKSKYECYPTMLLERGWDDKDED